jgi:hypothetical protein
MQLLKPDRHNFRHEWQRHFGNPRVQLEIIYEHIVEIAARGVLASTVRRQVRYMTDDVKAEETVHSDNA